MNKRKLFRRRFRGFLYSHYSIPTYFQTSKMAMPCCYASTGGPPVILRDIPWALITSALVGEMKRNTLGILRKKEFYSIYLFFSWLHELFFSVSFFFFSFTISATEWANPLNVKNENRRWFPFCLVYVSQH